jgi:hypothetical protein
MPFLGERQGERKQFHRLPVSLLQQQQQQQQQPDQPFKYFLEFEKFLQQEEGSGPRLYVPFKRVSID